MIKPAQCRAARTLKGLEQTALAEEAGISDRTLIDFERGERMPHPTTLRAIVDALDRLGVELIPENGGGVGVRVKIPGEEHKPQPQPRKRKPKAEG